MLPAHEARVDRPPRTVALRQIAPRSTGAQFPQDAVEDLTVIPPLLAAPAVLRQQRLDLRPCRVLELAASDHAASVPSTKTERLPRPPAFIRHALVVSDAVLLKAISCVRTGGAAVEDSLNRDEDVGTRLLAWPRSAPPPTPMGGEEIIELG